MQNTLQTNVMNDSITYKGKPIPAQEVVMDKNFFFHKCKEHSVILIWLKFAHGTKLDLANTCKIRRHRSITVHYDFCSKSWGP